jgi:hypothetical protein
MWTVGRVLVVSIAAARNEESASRIGRRKDWSCEWERGMGSAVAANCSLYLAWHDLPEHVAPHGVCETGFNLSL